MTKETVAEAKKDAHKLVAKITLGALIGSVALIGGSKLGNNELPANAYMQRFILDDGCLAGTPFDPAQGAMIHTNESSNGKLLTVVPAAANYINPSVLFLGTKSNGFGRSPDLYPTDYASAALLEDEECVQPNLGA